MRYCYFLKLGDIESAYKTLSDSYKKQYPLEHFAKNYGNMRNFDITNVLANNRNECSSDVQVTIKPQGTGLASNYIFHVVKEKGKWKIESCETVK